MASNDIRRTLYVPWVMWRDRVLQKLRDDHEPSPSLIIAPLDTASRTCRSRSRLRNIRSKVREHSSTAVDDSGPESNKRSLTQTTPKAPTSQDPTIDSVVIDKSAGTRSLFQVSVGVYYKPQEIQSGTPKRENTVWILTMSFSRLDWSGCP